MTTSIDNQTIPQQASFVKRTANAIGTGAVKIAEITGKVTLAATSAVAGGGLGIGLVNLAEKAFQHREHLNTYRKHLIDYIPSSLVGRLPKSMQPAEPVVEQAPEPVLKATTELQPPTNTENLPVIEQPAETRIEAEQTVQLKEINPTPKANMATVVVKTMRVAVGILVIGTAAKMAYTHYQSSRTPEKGSFIYESPFEVSPSESGQEHLPEAPKGERQLASPAPSKEIGQHTQAIDQSNITLVPKESIVVPKKPSIIVPERAKIVVPAKPELTLPPAPQPIEVGTNKGDVTLPGMSASEALAIVRAGGKLPEGLTLQRFGIPEAAVGRRFARGFVRRR